MNNNADLIRRDSVSKEIIDEKKAELSEIKKIAPFDKCDVCFSEVNTLFNKQLKLISSLQIYQADKEEKPDISTIPEEIMVKNVLEPLSNKQRLQISSLLMGDFSFSTMALNWPHLINQRYIFYFHFNLFLNCI